MSRKNINLSFEIGKKKMGRNKIIEVTTFVDSQEYDIA